MTNPYDRLIEATKEFADKDYTCRCPICFDASGFRTAIADAEAYRESERMSDNKNPTCSGCGGPHPFDTTVPSVVWNEVIRGDGLPDYLCMTCIVAAFVRVGRSFTASLVGSSFHCEAIEIRIHNKAATDAERISEENTRLRVSIFELQSKIDATEQRVKELEAELARITAWNKARAEELQANAPQFTALVYEALDNPEFGGDWPDLIVGHVVQLEEENVRLRQAVEDARRETWERAAVTLEDLGCGQPDCCDPIIIDVMSREFRRRAETPTEPPLDDTVIVPSNSKQCSATSPHAPHDYGGRPAQYCCGVATEQKHRCETERRKGERRQELSYVRSGSVVRSFGVTGQRNRRSLGAGRRRTEGGA